MDQNNNYYFKFIVGTITGISRKSFWHIYCLHVDWTPIWIISFAHETKSIEYDNS